MKTYLIPLLLSVALGSAAAAPLQDTSESPGPTVAAQDRLQEFDSELSAYERAWRKEQQELAKRAAEAQESGGMVPAMRMRPDYSTFVERLEQWVEEAEGEDEALYLTRIVQLDGLPQGLSGDLSWHAGMAAFDRLVAQHPKSPSWARLGYQLPGLDRSLGEARQSEVLALLAESPDGDVRGWTALALHAETVDTAALDSEPYKAARSALLTAAKAVTDESLRDSLEGQVELREKFGIGVAAPDIAGVDLDGVAFKLTDYRGKVIFLDFWGDW